MRPMPTPAGERLTTTPARRSCSTGTIRWSTAGTRSIDALVVTFDRDGPRALDARRHQGARARLSLRDAFPRCSATRWDEARQALSRHLHRHAISSASRRCRAPRRCSPSWRRRGALSRRGQQQDRAGAAAGGRASRLDPVHFARLVGAGDAAADKPDAAPVRAGARRQRDRRGRRSVWYRRRHRDRHGMRRQCRLPSRCLLAALEPRRSRIRAISAGASVSRLRSALAAISGGCDFVRPNLLSVSERDDLPVSLPAPRDGREPCDFAAEVYASFSAGTQDRTEGRRRTAPPD